MFSKNYKLDREKLFFLEGLDQIRDQREQNRLLEILRTAIHPHNPNRPITLKDYARFRGLGLAELKEVLRSEDKPLWVACRHCQTITLLNSGCNVKWFDAMSDHHAGHELAVFSSTAERYLHRDYRFVSPEEMIHDKADPVTIESLYLDRCISLELLRVLQWLDMETLEEAVQVIHFDAVELRFPQFSIPIREEFEALVHDYGLVYRPLSERLFGESEMVLGA